MEGGRKEGEKEKGEGEEKKRKLLKKIPALLLGILLVAEL